MNFAVPADQTVKSVRRRKAEQIPKFFLRTVRNEEHESDMIPIHGTVFKRLENGQRI